VAQEAPDTVFLAGDEAGLYLQVTTCRVWSPTGQMPIVRADPGRAKTNFYGALNLRIGQEVAMRSDLMSAEISAPYLGMLLEANPNVPLGSLIHRGCEESLSFKRTFKKHLQ
jgi:hypothetical protein